MSRARSRPGARGALLTWLLVAALGALALAVPAAADDEGDVSVGVRIPDDGGNLENAQLRWGINSESTGGAFFGRCNFLSAGRSGDAGRSRVWEPSDARGNNPLYRTRAGQVRIERPTGDGGWEPQTWDDKCLRPEDGKPTTTSPNDRGTGATIVMEGGTGTMDAAARSAEIHWEGSATVVYYGGMTYWWFADPVLRVGSNGRGELTATVGGYGADMHDPSKWVRLSTRQVRLATFSGVEFSERGMVITPDFRGVRLEVAADGPSGPQVREGSDWGSFPQDFVEFQFDTGQGGYWYTSGGIVDPRKPPSPIYVSYDASRPLAPTFRPYDPPADLEQPGFGGSALGGGPLGTAADGGQSGPEAGAPATGAGGGAAPAAAVAEEADLAALAIQPNAIEWLGANGLIPEAVADRLADPRERLAWALSAVCALSGLAFLGFRRGWLQLPGVSP